MRVTWSGGNLQFESPPLSLCWKKVAENLSAFKLGETELIKSSKVRDYEILVDQHLKSNNHINCIEKKARASLILRWIHMRYLMYNCVHVHTWDDGRIKKQYFAVTYNWCTSYPGYFKAGKEVKNWKQQSWKCGKRQKSHQVSVCKRLFYDVFKHSAADLSPKNQNSMAHVNLISISNLAP